MFAKVDYNEPGFSLKTSTNVILQHIYRADIVPTCHYQPVLGATRLNGGGLVEKRPKF